MAAVRASTSEQDIPALDSRSAMEQNYFELFGLPPGFDVNTTGLTQRYHDLQRQVHPDRYAADGERTRRLALQVAARVNDAFRTLRWPLTRARYLLELNGIDVGARERDGLPAEFLVEQIALREALADVRETADPAAEADSLLSRVRSESDQLGSELGSFFAAATPAALEAAVLSTLKLHFYDRLEQEVSALQAEIDDELT